MKRVEREDRPWNTSDGREVREFWLREIEEGEMKGEIEDEVMEEEKDEREWTKAVESIESPRFNWNKTVGFKIPKLREGVKEEMNGGDSEKKGEKVFEICETGENTLP